MRKHLLMRAADLFKRYRKSINPPFNKKDYLVLLGTLLILISLPVTVLTIKHLRDFRSKAASVGVTVDFTNTVRTLSPLTFGMDTSAYGWTGSTTRNISNDTQHQQRIRELKVPQMRMTLGYERPGDPNSRIVCYAEGCPRGTGVHAWIQGIKAAGAEPLIQVQMNAGEEAYWTTDAANMVRFMNITNNYNIKRWIVDNEPDNHGMSATTYANGFNQVYDAMKAVDPTIKIGGPATAWYNRGFITTFLQITNGRADFIDYHNYGQGGSNVRTDAQLLSETVKYENDPRDLRNLINTYYGAARGSQVEIELGEWNMSWTGDARMLTHFNSVWTASAIHHMLKEGVIFRLYADKNHSLGAICESPNETVGGTTYPCAVNDPMPAYHGIGMYTGESLFRHFGNRLVSSISSLSDVEISASDNPKNIVAINKNPTSTHQTTFNLIGVSSGSVEVWQKGPNDRGPVNKGTVNISNSSFSYDLGPYTVTAFLVNPSGTTDSTPPTVSVTAPVNGSTISGTVNITANASDNVGVARVEFRIDGTLVSTDTSSPYLYSWNTNSVSNGSHTIQARAFDAAGNMANSSVSVSVNNIAPVPTVDLRVEGSNGPITINYNTAATLSWTSTDAASCTASGGWSGSKPTSGSQSTGVLTAGRTYTLTCNGSGGSASDSVTVNVTNPPESVNGDLNSDGVVNVLDLSILLVNWRTNDPNSDLNDDGTVNVLDLSIMLTNWG